MNDAALLAKVLRAVADVLDEPIQLVANTSGLKENEVKLVLLLRQMPSDKAVPVQEYSQYATKAGYKNAGRVTGSGYAKATGAGGKMRQITKKGLDWLAEHDQLVP